MSDVTVDVCIDRARNGTVRVGQLFLHGRRGVASASFRHDEAWLASPGSYAIDPQLPLQTGSFHTGAGQELFRALADSAPDRWGRRLALRRNVGERRAKA